MGRTEWSRILLGVGLLGMLVGALDPLEGSVIILPSAAVAAVGAWVALASRRRLLYYGFAGIAVGVGLMFLLTAIGGVGGTSGRSAWWMLILIPYPIGWIAEVVGVILALIESFRRRSRKSDPVACRAPS